MSQIYESYEPDYPCESNKLFLVTCRLFVYFQKLNDGEKIFRNMDLDERLDVLIFGHLGSTIYIHQIGISR